MIDLKEMIGSFKQKHIFIQPHNFPDPDAIACAYGMQHLLKNMGMPTTIIYKGEMNYGSTYAMVKRLGIEIVEYKDSDLLNDDAEIILVDAQKGNANIIDLPGDELVCIDHHPTYDKVEYAFSDIRPEVGACASIITEYLIKYNIDIPENVATALLYGIKIDTANLTRGVSRLDLDMFYHLFYLADRELLTELDNSTLRQDDLKAYASAINSIKTFGTVCIANTGVDCQEALIASISDFILMLDSVNSTVVYSIKKDGIKVSVRTTSSKYDVGQIAKNALTGIGSGGGHEHMAGGFVPYDPDITDPLNDKKYIREITHEIEQRFANAFLGVSNE